VSYERFRLSNYSLAPVKMTLSIRFEADFADIFEVRGKKRERKGRMLPNVLRKDLLVLRYEGLDEVTREARIQFAPEPLEITASQATFDIELDPKGETAVAVMVACDVGDSHRPLLAYDAAMAEAGLAFGAEQTEDCTIQTSNAQFNEWWNRSVLDVRMMVTDTNEGPYPYAGVPWFSTPFGRDGVITALECLWIRPELARGVLAYLASTQAKEVNPAQDAEPGKILHETRKGEMAALNEIPFGLYYGSVDSTPLFVMLAGAYYERTDDLAFIQTATGLWSMYGNHPPVWTIRAGKIPMTRFRMRTVRWLKDRSPCVKFKGMCTTPKCRRRSWQMRWAISIVPVSFGGRRGRSRNVSKRHSGARKRQPMRLPWMARNGLVR
jgi:glycogen debranching enzyme